MQSSQLLPVSISWFHEISLHLFFTMLVTNTDPENRKMNPVFKVWNIIPKIFQIVPHLIADLSWKFYEIFTVLLLWDTPPRLAGWPWNILVRHETVETITSCVMLNISWKFMKIHSSVFLKCCHRHGFLRKNKPCMWGFKHISPKISAPFISPNISWKFHANPSMLFPAMLLTGKQRNTQTGRLTNQQRW